jgi:hypothetical protein
MAEAEQVEPDDDASAEPVPEAATDAEPGPEKKPTDEVRDDKQDRDEDENVQSAQDRAADPESARQWGQFAGQMDAAMKAMFGLGASGFAATGGTANFFLGDTAVGQVGDRTFGDRRRSVDMSIRSGVVAVEVLERIEQAYVEPERYAELKQALEQRQLLFIQARSGTGRTMTALHLLHAVCREGVQKLDPDARLKSLTAHELKPAHGYLLESLDPAQAQEFKAYHVDRLVEIMRERGCMMIVIVDESTTLPLSEIGDLVVSDFGRVRPDHLLQRYVEWGLTDPNSSADRAVLARPEVKEIVAQLTEEVPPRELAKLGELLVEVANDRLSLDIVREHYFRASEASIADWFDTQHDSEQRAFVIALAVFNDEPVQLVSTAATMLADRFRELEIPRRGDRARDVFAVQLSWRVEQARAELASEMEDTGFGQARVRKVRFRDDRFPRLVLEQVRAQYTQALDVVMDWLFDLGGLPAPQVRIRAGVAAGLLSQYDFVNVYNRIIVPWAVSGDPDERRAAVAALQVPGRLPGFDRVVAKLLQAWVHPRKVPQLHATAAQALGSTTSMSPGAALKLLRSAARHANQNTMYCIGEGVSDLFVRAEPNQVLRALVRWSRDEEFPERRETALLAVLITSCYVEVTVENSSERWPVLLWLAEHRPEERELIIVLFSRMLLTADFMRRGYLEIRRWLRKARREPTIVEPLARLLREVGEHSGETESIGFYLQKWAGDREGPTAAARAVFERFEQKEGPR